MRSGASRCGHVKGSFKRIFTPLRIPFELTVLRMATLVETVYILVYIQHSGTDASSSTIGGLAQG